jgi:hypothetical protein
MCKLQMQNNSYSHFLHKSFLFELFDSERRQEHVVKPCACCMFMARIPKFETRFCLSLVLNAVTAEVTLMGNHMKRFLFINFGVINFISAGPF